MKKGSVILTAVAVIFCIVLLVGVSVCAPFLADRFAEYRNLGEKVETVILSTYYICSIPALTALLCLLKIVDNIRKDQPFKQENTRLMAIVSFCCLAVALATLWSGFYYMPLWFICAAMLFVFLIVRVVRGCFIAAIYIKEENSLTI